MFLYGTNLKTFLILEIKSLFNLFNGLLDEDDETVRDPRVNFCECGHSSLKSIQSLDWKLIYSSSPRKLTLYNLKADPAEQRSVLEDHEGIARQFMGVLDRISENNLKLMPIFAGEAVEEGDLPQDLLEDLKKLGYVK